MSFYDIILWPFKWAVSAVLWVFHSLFTAIGMNPASGWTWVLCIIGLTLVMRTLTIPLFMRQIKSMRGMQEIQPEMAKIQAKYKGKTDQVSRQAQAQEQMELYKTHGVNPMASCLPMIVQMPIFFGLFRVLNGVSKAAGSHQGIMVLDAKMVEQFHAAHWMGAPLFSTLMKPASGGAITVTLAVIMIILMCASQFFTQRQLTSKNMSEQAKQSPMYRQQQMLLYVFPLVFAIGGINFPLGVLVYWTITNFWSMGQQWWVIKNNPTPGSQAEKELNQRRAEKGLPPRGKSRAQYEAELAEQRERAKGGQRKQPVSKNRQKKK